MVFSLYFFSFTIGSLTSLLSSIDTKENILIHKLALVDEFALEANLSREFTRRLKHALRYSSERKNHSFNEKQVIFSELPKALKYEVATNMHQGAAKLLAFFKDKDPVIISFVIPMLLPMFVEQDGSLYRKGEFADEIYFLMKGRINVVYGENNLLIASTQRGGYFGDIEVIKKIPRKYNARAERYTDLLTMNKQLLQSISTHFPCLWKEMTLVANQRDVVYDKVKLNIQEQLRRKDTPLTDDAIQKMNERVQKKLFKMHPELRGRTTASPTLADLCRLADLISQKLAV